MAVADCTFGRRGQWRGRGGTESGQERAHGAPLAATLCGQRGGWAVEGRHPPARAQAADGEENQASREPDAQREAAGCYPLERTHDGGAGWHRNVVGAQDLGAHGLKPHLTKTFKLSRDPNFVAKVEDIVGLYLNPPDKALVLAVDEKSQIQALDRTQPGLPMKKGRCGTMTHDYKRNGTTTLFAALNMLDGTVIGECMPRHRHREFLRFLKTIDQRTLPNLDLHLIVDNYATHKTPAVKRWLKRHARFHLHFTPTSGSWLNTVERFFAEITRKRIRRGVFKSVDELKQAIMDYLDNHNGHPKPYIWTKTATEIFSKVARAKQLLESQH